jgi:AbrB family looped-hinge helix DNA binding protein
MMDSHDSLVPMDKLTTVVTERGQVSIPAVIRKELHLKTGQPLVWEKISDRECLVKIPRKKALSATAMLGFAARFRGEKGRRSASVIAELRQGER